MKIAYLDICTGLSGDMLLSALIDAGYSRDDLKNHLKKLRCDSSFDVSFDEVVENGFRFTRMRLKDTEPKMSRTRTDFITIIQSSDLSGTIKQKAIGMFNRLAQVEARIHGKAPDDIHFHEISGIDTLIDIVGVICIFEDWGIAEVYSSPVPLGKGFVQTEHGRLPVPVPATLELLKNIPVYGTDFLTELVTPTGALLLQSFQPKFEMFPQIKLTQTGYGLGSKDIGCSNYLRILIGEAAEGYLEDEIAVIETHVDDMTPEHIGALYDIMFENGALDFCVKTIYMKKNRPGFCLTALVSKQDLMKFIHLFFDETTTFGVRYYLARRSIVSSIHEKEHCAPGAVLVRRAQNKKYQSKYHVEFDDVRQISKELGIPLKNIIRDMGNPITKR